MLQNRFISSNLDYDCILFCFNYNYANIDLDLDRVQEYIIRFVDDDILINLVRDFLERVVDNEYRR